MLSSIRCHLISPTLISPTKNIFVSFRLLPTLVSMGHQRVLSQGYISYRGRVRVDKDG